MTAAYLALLVLIAAERVVELVLSARNTAWARARGGLELGQGHFRVMTALHLAWFAGCALEVILLRRPLLPALAAPMVVVLVAAQALRYWAVATLGRRWNVRVVVVPGAPAVTGGPYALVRHPNYLAVVLEGFAVPLIHSAWITALGFTLLNALLLVVRIRCEERALSRHCDYGRRLGGRGRFWPGRALAALTAPMEDRAP